MKIISWNIDGAHSILRNTDFNQLLWMWQADIFAFQETKVLEPDLRLCFPLYHDYWSFYDTSDSPSPQSGVACFSKKKAKKVYYDMGDPEFDTEGRIITLEFDFYYFINVYVPQSQDVVTGKNSVHSMERRDYRTKFDRLLRDYVCDLNKIKPVILCGDFNASISNLDMSKNSSWIDDGITFSKDTNDQLRLLTKSGFTDTFRYKHPDQSGKYTHWSIKDSDRTTGTGRRLDYFFVSEDMAEKIDKAEIYSNIYGSDHCPIYLNIDMSVPVIRGDVVTNLTYDDMLLRESTGLYFYALKDTDLTRAWNTIDWDRAKQHLREMQREIVYACERRNPNSIKSAQFKLVASLDAKVLAIRSVTSRKGQAGIDHIKWNTPDEKMHAALSLTSKKYSAKPARVVERKDQRGKLRRFNLDTYHDRAMQTLYGYSLAPIAETWSDEKSFSNRKYRSTADANYYICRMFSGEDAPLWALKTDIQRCYESIDHEWIKKHIPLDTWVLTEFLRSGYFLYDKYYESDEGIGIGSRLSPYLANM
ncbi:MAG: reverse transcriptase N-terminal domain-containing protein, partial [Eubacterium sp.]|nr:reverse transcriptase N-terminal domain-containing protein [Eubacterium sp.]